MSEILYMSNLYVPTLKEDPADAEIASHKLLMRAGMIRKVASGIYAFLPLGMRVLQKVENIVREEMNATGAQEILMPALQPAELWLESGRWDDYGPELMRMNDRHDHGFCVPIGSFLPRSIRFRRSIATRFVRASGCCVAASSS